MTADQLAFDVGLPSRPVDAERRAILDLIAGDDLHRADRAAIVEAIVAVAHGAGGVVDMNHVRAHLTHPQSGDLTVYPRVIGAVVSSLASRGVLVADGWIVNQDRRGGNYGKPQRRWRLVAAAVAA